MTTITETTTELVFSLNDYSVRVDKISNNYRRLTMASRKTGATILMSTNNPKALQDKIIEVSNTKEICSCCDKDAVTYENMEGQVELFCHDCHQDMQDTYTECVSCGIYTTEVRGYNYKMCEHCCG